MPRARQSSQTGLTVDPPAVYDDARCPRQYTYSACSPVKNSSVSALDLDEEIAVLTLIPDHQSAGSINTGPSRFLLLPAVCHDQLNLTNRLLVR